MTSLTKNVAKVSSNGIAGLLLAAKTQLDKLELPNLNAAIARYPLDAILTGIATFSVLSLICGIVGLHLSFERKPEFGPFI